MPKVIKIGEYKDYTIIENGCLRDLTLDINERGLLVTMLSLPDTWDFNGIGLSSILPCGKAKVFSTLKGLEIGGYLQRKRLYANGRVVDWEYLICGRPIFKGLGDRKLTLEEAKTMLEDYANDNRYKSMNIDKEEGDFVTEDIEWLLIPTLKEKLNTLECIREKTDFLLKVVEYDLYFKNYADEISSNWYLHTGERYVAENFYLNVSDKNFIKDYGERVDNLYRVKELINKLLSVDDGVYDRDTVIAYAENEISLIRNIDDFEFSDEKIDKKVCKKTLDSLLKFMPKSQ